MIQLEAITEYEVRCPVCDKRESIIFTGMLLPNSDRNQAVEISRQLGWIFAVDPANSEWEVVCCPKCYLLRHAVNLSKLASFESEVNRGIYPGNQAGVISWGTDAPKLLRELADIIEEAKQDPNHSIIYSENIREKFIKDMEEL